MSTENEKPGKIIDFQVVKASKAQMEDFVLYVLNDDGEMFWTMPHDDDHEWERI